MLLSTPRDPTSSQVYTIVVLKNIVVEVQKKMLQESQEGKGVPIHIPFKRIIVCICIVTCRILFLLKAVDVLKLTIFALSHIETSSETRGKYYQGEEQVVINT